MEACRIQRFHENVETCIMTSEHIWKIPIYGKVVLTPKFTCIVLQAGKSTSAFPVSIYLSSSHTMPSKFQQKQHPHVHKSTHTHMDAHPHEHAWMVSTSSRMEVTPFVQDGVLSNANLPQTLISFIGSTLEIIWSLLLLDRTGRWDKRILKRWQTSNWEPAG